MNGQRVKLLKKKFVELYGTVNSENITKYRRFKRVFAKKVKISTITKEMFEGKNEN
jgi:hypothetical protein